MFLTGDHNLGNGKPAGYRFLQLWWTAELGAILGNKFRDRQPWRWLDGQYALQAR